MLLGLAWRWQAARETETHPLRTTRRSVAPRTPCWGCCRSMPTFRPSTRGPSSSSRARQREPRKAYGDSKRRIRSNSGQETAERARVEGHKKRKPRRRLPVRAKNKCRGGNVNGLARASMRARGRLRSCGQPWRSIPARRRRRLRLSGRRCSLRCRWGCRLQGVAQRVRRTPR